MPISCSSSFFLNQLCSILSKNKTGVFAVFSYPNSDDIHLFTAPQAIVNDKKKTIEGKLKGFYTVPFAFEKKKIYCIISPDNHYKVSQKELLKEWENDKQAFGFAQMQNISQYILQNKLRETTKHKNIDASIDENIKQCVKKIASSSQLTKVVLAATKYLQAKGTENLLLFFLDLKQKYPQAMVHLHYTPEWGLWIGASPEILVELKNKTFKTVALAGTKIIKHRQSPEEVKWGIKEIEEQSLVSQYIINCFKQIRVREFEEKGPKVIEMGNLAHICTEYFIDSKKIDLSKVTNEMLNLLHPTSAVCGMPKALAMRLINKYEVFDRQIFSGLVGTLLPQEDAGNEYHFYVNIRCFKVHANFFQLFAGAGLTHASNPQKEKKEIIAKMNLIEKILLHSH